MDLAAVVRQYCEENGRTLDHQLPDGSWVPLDPEDLDVILEGIRLNPNVGIAASFHGKAGLDGLDDAMRTRHRPGTKPDKQQLVYAYALELIAKGDTAERLRGATKEEKRSLFWNFHLITINRGLDLLGHS